MLSLQILHQYNTDLIQLGSHIQVACAPVLDMSFLGYKGRNHIVFKGRKADWVSVGTNYLQKSLQFK